jgi:hypothetical protein
MVKTTLYLPDELKRQIEYAAREQGRSEAEVIREKLTEGFAEQPRRVRGSWGQVHGGGESIAHRIDEILAEGFGADGLDS